MSHLILQDRRVHALLLEVDRALAAATKERGCKHCGGRLHEGGFARKPRGVPAQSRALFNRRVSYDCSQCRPRTLPPSVRFFDRRLYVAPAVALVCPRGPANQSWLCRKLGVAAATIKRWRRWWHERFACSALWSLKRADFAPPVDETALPGSAIARFGATDPGERLVQFLRFLLPASTGVLSV
jgi:hypothetical protein